MDNYEDKSDFQINQQVAWALGCHTLPVVDGDIDVFIVPLDEPQIFDPCNKASDAWPIITESQISIRFHWMTDRMLISNGIDQELIPKDGNVLRACMIIFLKMQSES